MEQGRYPAAYDLARAERSEREGEPRFDLYYDIAAIETDHLGEAVALRRVLAASSRRFWLGGDHYRDANGVETRLRYAISERQVVQLATNYLQRRYAKAAQQPRDADLATLVLGMTRGWPARLRPTLSLFALYGAQRADRRRMEQPIQESRRAGAKRDLFDAGAELELRIARRRRWAARSRRSAAARATPLAVSVGQWVIPSEAMRATRSARSLRAWATGWTPRRGRGRNYRLARQRRPWRRGRVADHGAGDAAEDLTDGTEDTLEDAGGSLDDLL